MRLVKYIMAAMVTLLLSFSCDVHEFPEVPETFTHHLKLRYETDLPIWNLDYSVQQGVTSKGEVLTRSVMETGHMRYVIRTYPMNSKSRSADGCVQEFVFTRDIAEGYDAEFAVDLMPGEYKIMVWSDLVESHSDEPFYDCSDFTGVTLLGEHCGSTDYRDAFRGCADIILASSVVEAVPGMTEILMERPLAKFEFISDDFDDFITKETQAAAKSGADESNTNPDSKVIDISDYRVEVIYPQFMPNTFHMFNDCPCDAATGVRFESRISRLNDKEASMGFDYVFVNGKDAMVTVQLAIYNRDGERISLTNPVNVPLKRSRHTVLKGSFLMQNASGGVGINPDFDGEFNVPI